MPYRVFNLKEAAEFLHLTEEQVERLARSGELPCERQGGRLVFRHQAIDEWASQQVLGYSDEKLSEFHRRSSAKYYDLSQDAAIISTLIKPEWIEPNLRCRTKASVIKEMADLADRTGLVCYPAELHASLIEREQLCSTALAGGLALLHRRMHEPYMFEDSFVVLGKTISQVPFGSPDGETTDIFFLVCCQDDRIHLHVLARLCMMCHQTSLLLELREAKDAKQMHALLVASEQRVLQEAKKA